MRVSNRTQVARWGGALLVALAPLPWVGIGSAAASGGTEYATVDGHEAFSSDANHPDYWGDQCSKLPGGSFSSYVLDADYAKVVVKAGSGEFANTIFNFAQQGETVWADTNGDGVYNPGGQDGDKQISHIIVCGGVTPSPSESETTRTPKPSDTESSETATPTDTESSDTATPTDTESSDTATPTDTESSDTATPTDSESESPTDTPTTDDSESPTNTSTSPIETGSSQPNTDGPSASVLPTRLERGETLPATGSGVPVGSAVLASLFLIGLGALLLLGPGRLTPEAYRRKH